VTAKRVAALRSTIFLYSILFFIVTSVHCIVFYSSQRNGHQNSDTFSSRHYNGTNEYMTGESSYAKSFQDRSRQYKGQDSVNPSRSGMDRTRNEYMTGGREYSSRPKQKEQYGRRHMDPSFSRNFDASSEYMTERSYAQPMDNRRHG
ncbi:hypothetical protein OSTOST_22810, partial [Ostertagia ostertagi]